MKKAELIEKKIREGKLSINEARILQDLEPIEEERCNQYCIYFTGIDFAIDSDGTYIK
ncbi:hypothetical protein [Bacillus sp. C1]